MPQSCAALKARPCKSPHSTHSAITYTHAHLQHQDAGRLKICQPLGPGLVEAGGTRLHVTQIHVSLQCGGGGGAFASIINAANMYIKQCDIMATVVAASRPNKAVRPLTVSSCDCLAPSCSSMLLAVLSTARVAVT